MRHTRDLYTLLCLQAPDLTTLGKQILSVSAPFEHHSSADCIAAARARLAASKSISLGNMPLLLADFNHHQAQSGETISSIFKGVGFRYMLPLYLWRAGRAPGEDTC